LFLFGGGRAGGWGGEGEERLLIECSIAGTSSCISVQNPFGILGQTAISMDE